jgi:hypothetical protein
VTDQRLHVLIAPPKHTRVGVTLVPSSVQLKMAIVERDTLFLK